jgi:2-(1,2-epoxy-1,2-dihydrophenyl)acetyl-CoA isomerase
MAAMRTSLVSTAHVFDESIGDGILRRRCEDILQHGARFAQLRGAVASGAAKGGHVSDAANVLLVERTEGVATLTMNRPESMNSLSIELKEALLDAVRDVSADPAVRAVVLTGAGRGFCVGQDLREHVALLEADDPAPLSTVTEHYNPLVLGLARMPKPVIAAVNGMAAGAGAGLSFACDFRIAAKTAGFLLAFANVGLTLDSGVSWTLPRIVGLARATALAILAEPINAESALEMGLVNAVVDPERALPTAHELAARLAAGPTAAYAAIKESIRYAATADLEAALSKEDELQTAMGRTEDHRNATLAFVAKQKPTFQGR